MAAGTLPSFGYGMIIGRYGPWSHSKLSGYRLIFVPSRTGHQAALLVTPHWFLVRRREVAYGRPLAWGSAGRDIAADGHDVDVVWRATGHSIARPWQGHETKVCSDRSS